MSDVVRFLLDGEIREIKNVTPTQSLLSYLRYEMHRTGSKEGCAEGDCGACTVVIGERTGEDISYKAVNACIIFLPTLHGKELLTVESLGGPDGALHPAQQALIDHHGSQCGFCTPGFVMSLYALYLTCDGTAPTLQQINDALAGNLCRCTGYGPIITAAQRMFDYPPPVDHPSPAARLARLKEIGRDREFALRQEGDGKIRHYFAPTTTAELAGRLLEFPAAVLLAGGTDVGLWVTKQHRELETVIYLGDVAALKQMSLRDGALHIGAAVTYAAAMQRIAGYYPDFGEILRRLGSVQIRNQGTLGGNIANGSPIGDSLPCLIALGAELRLRRGDKTRILPIEDYFIAYGEQDLKAGEFVEEIILPLPAAEQQFKAYKISKRFDQDISAVCLAVSFRRDGARVSSVRVACGGMAATPKRARACEAMLEGKPWRQDHVAQAMQALAQDFSPLSDMRASAAYRMQVAQNLLYKAFLETSAPDEGGRGDLRVLKSGGLSHG